MPRATRPEAGAVPAPLQIYLADISGMPLLSAEEERELARLIAGGDPRAREHMARANLRLVVNVARGYRGRGLDLADLIGEGNLGLLRAVEGYDPAFGTRFSTYATYWIKESIRRAIRDHGKVIRLPAYMVTLLAKWRRAKAALAVRLGRPPTDQEVGEALKLSKKKRAIVAEALRVDALTPHPDGVGEDSAIGDVLADEGSRPADAALMERDDLGRVLRRLDRLGDRDASVIRMRFGLGPHAPMTLREVGEVLGLTRERVRQIELDALGRLGSDAAAGEAPKARKPRRPNHPGVTLPQRRALRRRAVERVRAGEAARDVALSLGYDESAVFRWVRIASAV